MMSTNTILSRILFILYLGTVALICFMRPDRLPDLQKTIFGFPTDKVAHFMMFLPFPILSFMAFVPSAKKVWVVALHSFLVLLAGCAVAALTEYVQGFLPYRTKDFSDFKADLLALSISTLLVFLVDIFHFRNKRK